MDALQALGFTNWLRGNAPEPDGPNVPTQILEFFGKNKYFTYTYTDWTVKMVKLLEKKDLSKSNLTDTCWKTYEWLIRIHPDLFTQSSSNTPVMDIRVNQHQRTMPKNHLLMSSDAFRRMMGSGMAEAAENCLRINDNDIDDPSVMDFLAYLEKGHVEITDDNAMELLKLAQTQSLADLEDKVIRFLKTRLTLEHLPLLIKQALILKHPNLIKDCLAFAFSLSEQEIEQMIKESRQEGSSAEAIFLRRVLFLKKAGIQAKPGHDTSTLNVGQNIYDPRILEALNELFLIAPILLELKDIPFLTDEKLDKIMGKLTHLKHLSIKDPNITRIPNVEKLITIMCDNCPSLTSLNAQLATNIHSSGCGRMTTIKAPLATYINCPSCPSLTSLTAPAVTFLSCYQSTGLTALDIPSAIDITCWGCTNLASIRAPLAKSFDGNDCPNLLELNLPSAASLKANNCISLVSANVPMADLPEFKGCVNLIRVTATAAKVLYIRGCNKLTEINAAPDTLVTKY